jgi:hypothetical protein
VVDGAEDVHLGPRRKGVDEELAVVGFAVSPRLRSSAAGPSSAEPTSRFAPTPSPEIFTSSATGFSSLIAASRGKMRSRSIKSTKMCTVPPHGKPTSKASSSAIP